MSLDHISMGVKDLYDEMHRKWYARENSEARTDIMALLTKLRNVDIDRTYLEKILGDVNKAIAQYDQSSRGT